MCLDTELDLNRIAGLGLVGSKEFLAGVLLLMAGNANATKIPEPFLEDPFVGYMVDMHGWADMAILADAAALL